MLPLRYASRWRLASMLLLLLVAASMLMPVMWFWPERREFVNWFVGVDKWLPRIGDAVVTRDSNSPLAGSRVPARARTHDAHALGLGGFSDLAG